MKNFNQHKNFFEDILNDMLTLVGVLTSDGKTIFANNTALNIAGIKFEDVQGKMFHDAFWFQYSDETRQIIKNAIEVCRTGSSARHEIEIQTADGRLRWFDFSIHPIFDQYGNVEYLVPEGRDISLKKNAEKETAEGETRYQKLINSLPVSVFELDKKGNIEFVNQPALEIFGYMPEDFKQGSHSLDMIVPEDRQKALKHFDAIIKSKKSVPEKYLAKKKDGTVFPVLYHASVLMKNDKPIGVRGFAIDLGFREQWNRKLR